jgi:hypothetical protein
MPPKDDSPGKTERVARALEQIASVTIEGGILFALRHDQQWLIDNTLQLNAAVGRLTAVLANRQPVRNVIQVVAIVLKEGSSHATD